MCCRAFASSQQGAGRLVRPIIEKEDLIAHTLRINFNYSSGYGSNEGMMKGCLIKLCLKDTLEACFIMTKPL